MDLEISACLQKLSSPRRGAYLPPCPDTLFVRLPHLAGRYHGRSGKYDTEGQARRFEEDPNEMGVRVSVFKHLQSILPALAQLVHDLEHVGRLLVDDRLPKDFQIPQLTARRKGDVSKSQREASPDRVCEGRNVRIQLTSALNVSLPPGCPRLHSLAVSGRFGNRQSSVRLGRRCLGWWCLDGLRCSTFTLSAGETVLTAFEGGPLRLI